MPFRKSQNGVCVIGSDALLDFVDIIWGEQSTFEEKQEAWKQALDYLKKKGITGIRWDYLPADSISRRIITSSDDITYEVDEIDNATICFEGKDYSAYFEGLSKSARQNIRTAYNRISKDEKSYSFNYYIGADTERVQARRALKEYMPIYIKRLVSMYNFSKKRIIPRKYFHYVSGTTTGDDGFAADFRIDGQVAAFMIGYIDRVRKCVYIPRLAYDEQFSRYSPGTCLVNETVKVLINEGFTELNLDRGIEHYKLAMGGQIFSTFSYRIKIM